MALINLRNALMAEERTPTAKDYVQDGLIALWDGIENAGWGTHDPNATTWKDLVGSCNLTKGAMVTITRDSFASPQSNAFINSTFACTTDSFISNIAYYEAVGVKLAAASVLFIQQIGGNNNNIAAISLFDDTVFTGKVGGSRYGVSMNLSTNQRYSISAPYASSGSAYVNGVQKSIGVVPRYWNWASYISLCNHRGNYSGADTYSAVNCVRIYSRALTAAEIAANYAIDKARFKLPDAT